jgi:DNA-binding NarL/FixJ family response regulator
LDDHATIRHSLAARLSQEKDINIVGTFSGSQALIAGLQSAPADFLLIDYALGHNDIDGHNLIQLLRIRFPKPGSSSPPHTTIRPPLTAKQTDTIVDRWLAHNAYGPPSWRADSALPVARKRADPAAF